MEQKRKKEKTYICTVCGNKKKAKKQEQCCSKKMVDESKGTWNA